MSNVLWCHIKSHPPSGKSSVGFGHKFRREFPKEYHQVGSNDRNLPDTCHCLKEISVSKDRKILLHDLSTLRILGIVTRVSQWGRADARVVWRDAYPPLGECSNTTATGRGDAFIL